MSYSELVHEIRSQMSELRAYVAAIGVEIDDRITHQLPRTVVGHLPAAVALLHRHSPCRQPGGSGAHVGLVGAPAQGVDMVVLQQQQMLGRVDEITTENSRRAAGGLTPWLVIIFLIVLAHLGLGVLDVLEVNLLDLLGIDNPLKNLMGPSGDGG